MAVLSAAVLERLATDAGLASPSVVIKRLSEPSLEASIDPLRGLYPASMIKVSLAAALWASPGFSPTTKVAVTEANMTANDAASPLEPGFEATLEELAELMLTRSDNVATNVLIDVVGRDRATDFARSIGLESTAIRRKLSGAEPLIDDPQATGRNAHPAADAARLFTLIAERKVRGAQWLFDALLRQEWNEKLPRGLRAGDRFAHKTGDTSEVTHDGGILETARGTRYVIVVYTAFPTAPASDDRLADFMTNLREYLL